LAKGKNNMSLVRHMTISAVLLGLFAIIGTAMVAFIYDATAERIDANHRAFLLKSLHILVPPEQHDNDLFTDVITVTNKDLLGTDKPVRVYRADGYSGSIELLVAIRYDGKLAGVRVVNHKETPGLGDAIDASRSDWILGFKNRSLTDPDKKGWAVKRDGGIFDQFTGATISPRAVVNAVYRSLLYFDAHKDELFDKPSIPLEG
jgi:electron transport complex protein RnfG